MIYRAYKDECYTIGLLNFPDGLYDGYVDISPKEHEEFSKVDKEFWRWQDILRKRYKKRMI